MSACPRKIADYRTGSWGGMEIIMEPDGSFWVAVDDGASVQLRVDSERALKDFFAKKCNRFIELKWGLTGTITLMHDHYTGDSMYVAWGKESGERMFLAGGAAVAGLRSLLTEPVQDGQLFLAGGNGYAVLTKAHGMAINSVLHLSEHDGDDLVLHREHSKVPCCSIDLAASMIRFTSEAGHELEIVSRFMPQISDWFVTKHFSPDDSLLDINEG